MRRRLAHAFVRTFAFPVAVASMVACGGSDRAAKPDSAAGLTAAADTVAAQGRFASDGTLVIQTTPALQALLRAAADSFAKREAIAVVFSAPPEGAEERPLGISPAADLVIVTLADMPRLPVDSTSWALPFAESLPDSASNAASDSLRRADSARTPVRAPRGRRATGRRADSIRLDSVRRATAMQDSVLADRARADSARTVVLSVPAQAPNSAAAERFVRYLLTDGRATLFGSGLQVLPILALRGNASSPGIAALVDTIIPRDSVQKADSIPQP